MAGIILVADDSPTIRAFVRLALKGLGAELVEAADGAQAIERARTIFPDLALIDLHMPGTDGLAALQALRAEPDPRLSQLPILLLTAEKNEALLASCEQAGATGFVEKPIKPAALLEAVRKQLAANPRERQP